MNDADYPALWRAADSASMEGQTWYKRVTKADLALLVLGSLVGALASVVSDDVRAVIAVVTGILLTAGLVAKLVVRTRRDEKHWFNGRAVAETVKSLAWQYMMRGEAFQSDATADDTFRRNLREALNAAISLHTKSIEDGNGASQITDFMRSTRQLSLEERRDFYCAERLQDQISWYSRKARFSRERADIWYWVSVAAQFGAIVMAFLLAGDVLPSLNLIGLFGSIGSAATAWLQLGRYDELRASYALAAMELTTIKDIASMVTTEEELVDVVTDGEQAISREHTMWMAKRGEQAIRIP